MVLFGLTKKILENWVALIRELYCAGLPHVGEPAPELQRGQRLRPLHQQPGLRGNDAS